MTKKLMINEMKNESKQIAKSKWLLILYEINETKMVCITAEMALNINVKMGVFSFFIYRCNE